MTTPDQPRSYTIATSGRVGPRRWWILRIYPSPELMRRAASAYHPSVDFSECLGCCQAAVWLDDRGTLRRYGNNGYAGIIRLVAGHMSAEIVAHELLHAAVAVYRMNVAEDVRLGRTVGGREEQLAYIFGDLYSAAVAALNPSQEVSPIGGKPSKGTRADRRLAENKPTTPAPVKKAAKPKKATG